MEQNTPKEKIVLLWNSGKESLLTLCSLVKQGGFEVAALLTMVNYNGKLYTHGVTSKLLLEQAKALGVPLITVAMPSVPSMEERDKALKQVFQKFKQEGINHIASGLINNAKIREDWEILLHHFGMKAVFPLWQKNPNELMQAFLEMGFRAIVTSVDPRVLGRNFTGREITRDFLGDLPKAINVCAENGEYRSFVYDGPAFANPVPFKKGVVMLRDNLYYCDLTENTES